MLCRGSDGDGVGRRQPLYARGDATVAYDRLAFAKQTHWDEFLAVL